MDGRWWIGKCLGLSSVIIVSRLVEVMALLTSHQDPHMHDNKHIGYFSRNFWCYNAGVNSQHNTTLSAIMFPSEKMQERSRWLLWKGPYNMNAPVPESTSSSNTKSPFRTMAPVAESTSSSNTNAQQAKVYHRSTNISDASACVLRQLQSSVQYRASTQKPSRKKLS